MKSRGFTLVEMLVVIAILGILSGLLLPTLAHGKSRAKSLLCQNNLSQIGKALALYTADFHRYPGSRGAPIPVPLNLPTNFVGWETMWDQRLLPFVAENGTIFRCPSETPFSHGLLTNYTYGYNAYGTALQSTTLNLGLGRYQPPELDPSLPALEVRDSQVAVPADMLAVGDLSDLPGVFVGTIIPEGGPPWAGTAAVRHHGGANFVFCDGHLEFAERQKWIAATPAARSRWNNDHEPHAETWW